MPSEPFNIDALPKGTLLRNYIDALRAHAEAETRRADELAAEVGRLKGLINGDANFIRMDATNRDVHMQIEHPLVALMADSLAKMIGSNNYVEMAMTHNQTGEEFTVHLQRRSRPTPHELREQAEAAVNERENERLKWQKNFLDTKAALTRAQNSDQHNFDRWQKAEAALAEAREALHKFGTHKRLCAYVDGGFCDCGLHAAKERK